MNRTISIIVGSLAGIWLISCAGPGNTLEQQNFPADLTQPFLSYNRDLGSFREADSGWLQRIVRRIRGPVIPVLLHRPVALADGGEAGIFVVDADAARVLRYDIIGEQQADVTVIGEDELSAPAGIAVWQNLIYVSDNRDSLIHRFHTDLQAMGTLTVVGLERPGQLRINPLNGDLVIVDQGRHQLLIVNAAGDLKQVLSEDYLRGPVACDFTGDGQLVVLDGISRRVELFSANYEHVSGFGGYDRVPGSFAFPRGIAVSPDGYLFITDAVLNTVQIFSLNGALLYYWGQPGTAPGEFLQPTALVFDTDANLYIADQYNNRVQVFHYYVQEQ